MWRINTNNWSLHSHSSLLMVLVMLSGQVQSLCGLVSAEGLIEAWQEGVVLRTHSDSFTVVEGQYFEYFPILCDGWRVERSVTWYLSGGTQTFTKLSPFLHCKLWSALSHCLFIVLLDEIIISDLRLSNDDYSLHLSVCSISTSIVPTAFLGWKEKTKIGFVKLLVAKETLTTGESEDCEGYDRVPSAWSA